MVMTMATRTMAMMLAERDDDDDDDEVKGGTGGGGLLLFCLSRRLTPLLLIFLPSPSLVPSVLLVFLVGAFCRCRISVVSFVLIVSFGLAGLLLFACPATPLLIFFRLSSLVTSVLPIFAW